MQPHQAPGTMRAQSIVLMTLMGGDLIESGGSC
jgi:hypothetical protein